MKFTESLLALLLAYEVIASAQAAGLRARRLQGPPGGNTYQTIENMLDTVFGSSGPGPNNGCQQQGGPNGNYVCLDSNGSATLVGSSGPGPSQLVSLQACITGPGPNVNKCHTILFKSNNDQTDLDDSEDLLMWYLLTTKYNNCQEQNGPPGPGAQTVTTTCNQGPDSATYVVTENNSPQGNDYQPKTLEVCNGPGGPGQNCKTLTFEEGEQESNLKQAKSLIEG